MNEVLRLFKRLNAQSFILKRQNFDSSFVSGIMHFEQLRHLENVLV